MLTLRDILRIASETLLDIRTIRRAYEGRPLQLANHQQVALAAERLGLPPPPPCQPRPRRGASDQ